VVKQIFFAVVFLFHFVVAVSCIYLFVQITSLTCCWFFIWWSTQYTAIPKKEKVHCRKKKLPLKSTTPEELCEFYTPDELCEVYTSDELRRTFGLPKLYEMLPRHKLALMVFPRPKLRLSKTEASCFSWSINNV
jgi:hypothetical protein